MREQNETFILKEFLVGLVVMVFFLTILLWGLRKITESGQFKNLFSGNKKAALVIEPDYCSSYKMLGVIPKDKKQEFERLIKRSGWQDKKLKYRLVFTDSTKNRFTYNTESENNEIPKEANTIQCEQGGVSYSDANNLLVSSLLNVNPEKLKDFAMFQVGNKGDYLLPASPNASLGGPASNGLDSGREWVNNFSLKGGLQLPGIPVDSLERNCFSLKASSTSIYKGPEKIKLTSGEVDAYKVESLWTATDSALLTSRKKIEECYSYDGNYDSQAGVKVKEELWFVPNLGIVKRKISPVQISGQAYFLPNGYLPLEITDEMVSNN